MPTELTPVDIGIDLGTTFSVLAVKGVVPVRADYPQGDYLEEIDVTILRTPDGDLTFPSVLWIHPTTGDVVIGAEAREKAQEGFSPIMFSKRSIGTDEPLRINQRSLTALEVATEILRHMKQCAERALGRPVRRAVVTHPAYFNTNQVEETRAAAVAAGFVMERSDQLLMEPTAAALAYLQTDTRDPLSILTYDLGGGTFDVTILRRQEGDTKIISHDGDRLLGGYQFDRALVQWLLDRLRAQGRVIAIDPENPVDRGRYTRLMRLAESIKIKLSQQTNKKTYVSINAPDILIDDRLRPVPIQDRINAAEFAALIQEDLGKTVACCHSAIAKAKHSVPDLRLDCLVFVGGSTYGPWVADAVLNAFGMRGEPFHPDLCVAAGAAMHAVRLPKITNSERGWSLQIDSEDSTPLPTTTIAGQLLPSAPASVEKSPIPSLSGITVRLRAEPGFRHEKNCGSDGTFAFEDVPLREGVATVIRIEAVDASGHGLMTHEFAVRYQPEQMTSQIWPTLPKAILIETASGRKMVAADGTPLPTPEYQIALQRTQQDDLVSIPVFQEEEPVGQIVIEKIPESAGRGAPIELKLRVTEKNELVGSAAVLTADGRTAVQCPVRLVFPTIPIPSIPEMRRAAGTMAEQRQQLQSVCDEPERRTMLMAEGNRLEQKVQTLLNEVNPDVQSVYRELRNLERLLVPPRDELRPPRSHFQWRLTACRTILSQHASNPEVNVYSSEVEKADHDGEEAHRTKNQRQWSAANEKVARLHEQLKNVVAPPSTSSATEVTTALLKTAWLAEIGDVRDKLKRKLSSLGSRKEADPRVRERVSSVESAIKQLESSIKAVPDDRDVDQARSQLQLLVQPQQPGLIEAIENLAHDTQDRE